MTTPANPAMVYRVSDEAAAKRQFIDGLGDLVDALNYGPESVGNAPVPPIAASAQGLTLSPWVTVAAVAAVAWLLLHR